MKISTLLESYKISYDLTKKKNSSSIIDFLKLNEITPQEISDAVVKAKNSSQFKKVIELGYVYRSSPLQEKRATLFFEAADGDSQITCYATGQARAANRGGFDNQQFLAAPIPTLPPTQLGDMPNNTDVLIDNLKKALQAVINKFTNKANKKLDGMAAVDERMRKFGFPEGFRIYLDGAEKNTKYIYNDEGQIMIDAKAGGAIGAVVIDFGNNPDLGPNVDFGTVEGIWRVLIKGEKIKSYKGLEKFFNSGLIAIDIQAKDPNFKELAKIMKAGVRKVYFKSNPLEMPLMSVVKIAYEEIAIARRESGNLAKDPNVKKYLDMLNKVIHRTADILDVQDDLIDNGFSVAAKQ